MSAKPRKPKAADEVEAIDAVPDVEPVVVPAVVAVRIPECPAGNSSQGMKTPEVVAWWFKYFPEEAAVKYAGLTLV